LLEVAEEMKLFSSEILRLSGGIREYRNLVHPAVELRKRIKPTKRRAEIARDALRLALQALDEAYREIPTELYVIDIQGIGGVQISSPPEVTRAVRELASPRGIIINHIPTLAQLDHLVHNPPRKAVIFNGHGELVPVPSSWRTDWRSFFVSLGEKVRDFGWIYVSLAGYPFWWYTRDSQPVACRGDGLNAFLSVANATANCMTAGGVRLTDDGLAALRNFNIQTGIHSVVSRCATWTGIKPIKIFLEGSSGFGASAVRIGRGSFLHIGYMPQDLDADRNSGLADRSRGRLAVAFALNIYS